MEEQCELRHVMSLWHLEQTKQITNGNELMEFIEIKQLIIIEYRIHFLVLMMFLRNMFG